MKIIIVVISCSFLFFTVIYSGSPIPAGGNLEAMPVILEPTYYDNTNTYKDIGFDFPPASVIEPLLSAAVSNGLPGAVILIESPYWGAWACAKGMVDIKNGIEMKNNSLSRVGSITKVFVSVIVMQLAEEGSLSLDDPVSNYLPLEIIRNVNNAGAATIRQLLNHTSGIANYTEYLTPEKYYLAGNNEKLNSKNIIGMVSGKPAYFSPGKGWHYSNTAYILLGLIIEDITGISLEENLLKRIFAPLSLKSTYYDPDNPVHLETSRGYVDYYSNGKYLDMTDFDSSCRTPDGGIVSCVYDLAGFIEAVFKDRLLLSYSSVYEMTNKMNYWRSESSVRIDYGLGLERLSFADGTVMFGHSGAHGSYTAYMYYCPEGEMSITALFNSSRLTGKSALIINSLWPKVLSITEKAGKAHDLRP